MRKRSVVLLSGGLDSAANLALCHEQDLPILALTIQYGQRAYPKERDAAQALCRYYGVSHRLLDLNWIGELGGNSLTDAKRDLPDPESLDDPQVTVESARQVWVPNRNGIFINAAAAIAESLEAEQVIVGFNREEAATFPDNTTEFIEKATAALVFSTSNGVRVHCYTDRMDKREIVVRLNKLSRPFPFESIWSCYRSGERPCEKCESCKRLTRALSARRL